MSEPKKKTRSNDPLYRGEKYKANPYPFAFTRVRNLETGETIYKRTVSPQVPDRILKTGNRKELQKFYLDNYSTLTAADKRYLQARLHTANLVDRLEKKALKDIYEGKAPTRPHVANRKGFVGFESLKLDGPQTSGDGCWSCAMQLVLKSRGINMSQEEIRAFKPDYPAGEENMSEEQMLRSNRDTGFSPYENADLIQKVLPNSTIQSVTFNPLDEELVLMGGEIPVPQPPARLNLIQQQQWIQNRRMQLMQERQKRAQELFKKKSKELFIQKVREGIFDAQSPVILNRGGAHYVTITGISSDGNKIRIEDSFQSGGKTTKTVKVDDLINKYLAPGMQGLDLCWVRDLPVRSSQEMPEETDLLEDAEGSAVMKQNGEIELRETGSFVTIHKEQRPQIGQLKGQEVNKILYMDQTELQQELGARLVGYGEDENGNPLQMLATENTYLPRKARLLKDPSIKAELDAAEEEEKQEKLHQEQELKDLVESLDKPEYYQIEDEDPKEEPAAGTFDAFEANQKAQLYQQGPDKAAYIANLYALNLIKTSPEKRQADEAADRKLAEALTLIDDLKTLQAKTDEASAARIREIHTQLQEKYPSLQDYRNQGSSLLRLSPELLEKEVKTLNHTEKARITPPEQMKIEKLANLAMPVVKDMLGEAKGDLTLPFTAVGEDQRELVHQVDAYAQEKYYLEPNPENLPGKPDWIEKRKVLNDAFAAMEATGTGKNYIGVRRSRNSDEYTQMMQTYREYKAALDKGETPSGMQNRKLIEDMINYVKPRMSVRSTEGTGKLRFDSTMRALQTLMPAARYNRLLGRINQKREVGAGEKNFITADTYAPQTTAAFVKKKVQEASSKTGSSFDKVCSEILAARMLADQSPRREKTLVMDPYDPAVKNQLDQQARQLRRDPAFRQAVRQLRESTRDLTPELTTIARRNRLMESGTGLENLYVSIKSEQLLQGPQA